MDFDSFEFCEFLVDDCITTSTDWVRAWNGTKNTAYIWRINMTNNGDEVIMLEESTALFLIRATSGGAGNIAKAMFILDNSTATQEDGGLYPNHGTHLQINVTQTVYFGEDIPGDTHAHESTLNEAAIYAANLLIFAHEDTNGNGSYDVSADISYSQNLPFQALKLDD